MRAPKPAAPTTARRPPSSSPAARSVLDARLHRSYCKLHATTESFRQRITPAGALVFWAMLAAGAFIDVTQSRTHQLFALLFCVLLGSLLCLLGPRDRCSIERLVPRHGSVGVPFSYRLRLRNDTRRTLRGRTLHEGVPDPRPTLAQFATLAEPGEARRNVFDRRYRFYRWRWLVARLTAARPVPVPLPELRPGDALDLRAELTPLRRGRLTLSRPRLARTDLFGLVRRFTTVTDSPVSISIFPRRFRLPPLALPGQTRRLHTGGVAFAGSVGDSEEFVSVREYRPGDPLRRLHWAGWARTQRPVVKEFQEEYYVRHALLLDTAGGGPEADAFEDAVSLAASFACTVDERDSLLDLMLIGNRAYVFTAGRGLAHTAQMLEILAGVELQPQADPDALRRLVLRHADRLSGCLIVLLRWDEPRRRLIDGLRSRGLPLRAYVIAQAPPPESKPYPSDVHWLPTGHVEEALAAVQKRPLTPVAGLPQFARPFQGTLCTRF